MSETKMKVIDRRMFTADGELRDEYRDRVDPDRAPRPDAPRPDAPRPDAPRPDAPRPAAARPAAARPAPAEAAPSTAASQTTAVREAPGPSEENPSAPQLADLINILAQTGASYIQQARATAAPDLMQMARLHVDLLDVLERKTAGNLSREESQMLQDVRRQLRLALG